MCSLLSPLSIYEYDIRAIRERTTGTASSKGVSVQRIQLSCRLIIITQQIIEQNLHEIPIWLNKVLPIRTAGNKRDGE